MEIIIRHSEKEDIPGIKTILEQPSCINNTMQLPFQTIESVEKRFGSMPDDLFSLVAIVEEQVVGQVGLKTLPMPRRKHVASVGLVVHEEFRGNGIGYKLLESAIDFAENWLAIKRIEIEVYSDNEIAISLYKKLGFIVEGTAKSYAFRNGVYADVLHMAKIST